MSDQFNGGNAALVLIDHQVGTIGWVKSVSQDTLKQNTVMLAKVAKILGLPVVITSSMEFMVQGPIIPELAEAAPEAHAARVQRAGIINAMEDENFAAAIKATGRKKIVLAGVTNDVCTVFPALTLIKQGYEVHVVADAGGSPSLIGEDMALRRMAAAGVTLVGTNQVIAELTGNWATEEGGQVVQILMGALMAG